MFGKSNEEGQPAVEKIEPVPGNGLYCEEKASLVLEEPIRHSPDKLLGPLLPIFGHVLHAGFDEFVF